jgi:hypothetical protein
MAAEFPLRENMFNKFEMVGETLAEYCGTFDWGEWPVLKPRLAIPPNR